MTIVWFFVGLLSLCAIGFWPTTIFWFLGHAARAIATAIEEHPEQLADDRERRLEGIVGGPRRVTRASYYTDRRRRREDE